MAGSPALIAEHRLVRRLRDAGALSPETACALPPLRWMEQRRLARLLDRSVVRETGPGRFYLDPDTWAQYRRERQRLVLTLLGVVAVVLLLIGWLARPR
ncbi:MAG: hypothetical protein JO040_14930 [Gemmatimonadetes bacterium]|nr:hypothetical protein [Gemmatimonadota bacterium]